MSHLLMVGTLALSLSESPTPDQSAELWQEDLEAVLNVLLSEHDNPYYFTPRKDFEQVVQSYSDALPVLNRAERIAGLARILALVGDGHTWLPMHPLPFDGMPPGPQFSSLPVRFELFDNGLFIVGATDGYADIVGTQVIGVGETSSEDAVASVMELLPRDAVNFSRGFVGEWLMQYELLQALELADQNVELTVSDGYSELSVSIEPLMPEARYDWVFSMDSGPLGETSWVTAADPQPFWMEESNQTWRIEVLGDAVYLQINQISNGPEMSYADMARQAVDMAMDLESPALIVDLRRNMGGDGTLNVDLVSAIADAGEINRQGRLMVLTSNMTHSAAIMLVSDLEQQTNAIFLGQDTADRPNHYGETNIFVTPNSGLPLIYASEYYQTSSPDDDRLFHSPDIAIAYTFEDYATGNDPVLSAAIHEITGD